MNSLQIQPHFYHGQHYICRKIQQCHCVKLKLHTPFGEVKEIQTTTDLNAFILREKGLLWKELQRSLNGDINGCTVFELNALNDELQQIGKVYAKTLLSYPLKNFDVEAGNEEALAFGVQYLQVLKGKDSYYVGAIVPKGLHELGITALNSSKALEEDEFFKALQPHITFIPPSSHINPSISLKKLKLLKGLQPLEITYDTICLRESGHVILKGYSCGYEALKRKLAQSLNVEPNTRDVHVTLGRTKLDANGKIHKAPAVFGFIRGEDGLLYKKLKVAIKQTISLPVDDYPIEQRKLNAEYIPKKIPKYELVREKTLFEERKQLVIALQNSVKTAHRENTGRADKEKAKLPFPIEKLELALQGVDDIGRIPLTFSMSENGEQKWLDFCEEAKAIFTKYGLSDIVVQILGSSVHGFTRNPTRDVKAWSESSDIDLATFSEQLCDYCLREGVQVNHNITLMGKYTVFKNNKDLERPGIGFHETPLGKEIAAHLKKWAHILFGLKASDDALNLKINIQKRPFFEAIALYHT